MLQTGAIEGTAELLLRAAGLTSTEPPNPDQMAERLLGSAARPVPPHILRRDGALARVGADWCIFLRADIPEARRRFAILHELSHWAIGTGATEEQCDALAAAMLAPRAAFLAALRAHGAMLPRLARYFRTSESCIALRLGEATDKPLALITPMSVRLRGAPYEWPADTKLRELATRPALKGLRKAVLRDDRTRAMLVAK